MSLPLLALVHQDEPQNTKTDHLCAVAHHLAALLARGHSVRRQDLNRLMEEAFSASDATGAWSMRDAYDALEAAQVLLLKSADGVTIDLASADAFSSLRRFELSLPTQTYRSEHQVEMQQFSTPISLAWLAAQAARIEPDDHVLEPSAGTGMLAVHAFRAGAALTLNERDTGRAALLGKLLDQPVTTYDAEFINDRIPADRHPTVVLINPPFSRSEGRGEDRFAGARHLHSALLRLAPGGRCVAIMPPNFAADGSAATAYAAVCEVAMPRMEVTILGSPYAKHGTTIAIRVLVFDKGWTGTTERHTARDIDAAAMILRAAPPRFEPPETPPPAVAILPLRARRPASAPLLGGVARRELTTPDRIAATNSIAPVTYKVLDQPLPPGDPVGIYSSWRLARIEIEGAAPHPDALVESVAMASVAPPIPRYRPHLQKSAFDALSDAQLETITHAGDAHSRNLAGLFAPNPAGDRLLDDAEGTAYRTGYFIADGTGVGKGREAAGCILDQWNRGNKRAIWISASDLIEDARRDWAALGGLSIDIQPIGAFPLGTAITMDSGIIFLTYAALRSSRHDSASRLQQLLAWTGTDFEGIILFDESHAMAHAAGTDTEFGKAHGSEQGLAGVRLQNALPRARVIYMSATGAAKPEHLSYATRLGLWGPGSAFSNRDAFMAAMEEGGIAAMEVICRDLKAMGLYTARALSFAGVEYDPLEHRLTPEQIAVYDAYADAWAIIHRHLKDVLAESGIVDRMSGKVQNARARGSALSAFEFAKQRFFSSLLVSMKMPTLIDAIERELGAGHAVLVQLASTGEAILDRRLSELSAEERANLEIEVSPRETVIDYLKNAFPTRQMRTFRASDGAMRAEPMFDGDGNPVRCQAALAARDTLIEQLCSLPSIPTALDALIWHFGADEVAEITGRTRRIILDADGRQKIDRRSPKANVAETRAFMDGRKRIGAFSLAGSTGRSMHSDRASPSGFMQRVHFLVELGFRLMSAVQGFGRSNRTNQVTPPIYRPLTTDCRGERRFLSTIIRGLEALGALTRGQRQTGGQNLFDPADNLESDYAREALVRWFHLLHAGKLRSVTLSQFEEMAGLELETESGELKEHLPPIHRWLNRILALKIATQDAIFDEFMGLVENRVEAARAAGTLDLGIETIRAERIEILSDRLLRTDPVTGAETRLLRLELHRRPQVTSWTRLVIENKGIEDIAYLRNARSARVALRAPSWPSMDDEGQLTPMCYLLRPAKSPRVALDSLAESHWEEIDRESFQAFWEQEVAEAERHLEIDTISVATGLLLPVWHKLPQDDVRVWRIDDGKSLAILGRIIRPSAIQKLEHQFGLDGHVALSPDEILDGTRDGDGVTIPGWGDARLLSVSVNGSRRLEIRNFLPDDRDRLKAAGAFSEVVQYRTRLFLPPNSARDILALLIAERA